MIYLLPTKKGIYIRDGTHTYCVRPPFFSLRNFRNLKSRSIIVGFVGPRGSCKSVGAARTVILDFMLVGKTVWSNMEIGFNLVSNGQSVEMKSKPLDKLSLVELDEVYSNGLIYVDEANLIAEARRAMSQENLMFSYILQQLRKRRLTIIWSAQSELHCEERLRFQTDIFIMCEDVSISKPNCGIGELSLWKAHDFSGIVKGKSPNNSADAVFYQGVQWIKPWWNTCNTWEIQPKEASAKDQQKEAMQKEAKGIALEMAEYLRKEGIERVQIRDLWQRWGVDSHKMKILVGTELSQIHGIVKEDGDTQSRWYEVRDETGN